LNSFSRLFFLGLLLATVVIAACEDNPVPPPPDPPAQINVKYRLTYNSDITDTVKGLQSNDVFDVIVDSQDRTWVATQAGVSRFRGTTGDGKWNQNDELPNPKCRSLLEHNGKVWVGTWGGGVATHEMTSGMWSKLNVDSGLVNDMVADIAGVGNTIYFATNDGASIYTDDPQLDLNDRWETMPVGRPSDGILSPVVSVVLIAQTSTRGQEVWFGPRMEELIQFGDEDNHGITVFREGLSQPIYYTMVNSGLTEPNVNDIYFDESTQLFWVAFSTTGLASVDVDASTWTYYTKVDGLPSDVIYSITKVGGVLWVGTQSGVAEMKSNGKFQGFGSSGGLPGDRVRRVFSDDPNELWSGYIGQGAALLDP
jgi:ligand-binding sensor domain-containing protein